MDSNQILMLVLLGLLVIALIIVPMFTNRRKARAFGELIAAVQPGCIVKTVSGMIAKVVAVNEITPVDKEIVLETGIEGQKSTLVFDIQCVLQIIKLADGRPFIPSYMQPRVARPAPIEPPLDEEVADEAVTDEPTELVSKAETAE